MRVDLLQGLSMNDATSRFLDQLPLQKSQRLDRLFELTKSQIVHGEYIKRCALSGSRYSQFKSWAKNAYPDMTEDDMKSFCRNINQASSVFRNWEKVVTNCTDYAMRWIDVREFSIDRLYRCQRIAFVLDLNSANRPDGVMPDVDERNYCEESYQRLKQKVITDGILSEIGFNSETSSAIFEDRPLTASPRS